jgi:hypothetical protein
MPTINLDNSNRNIYLSESIHANGNMDVSDKVSELYTQLSVVLQARKINSARLRFPLQDDQAIAYSKKANTQKNATHLSLGLGAAAITMGTGFMPVFVKHITEIGKVACQTLNSAVGTGYDTYRTVNQNNKESYLTGYDASLNTHQQLLQENNDTLRTAEQQAQEAESKAAQAEQRKSKVLEMLYS